MVKKSKKRGLLPSGNFRQGIVQRRSNRLASIVLRRSNRNSIAGGEQISTTRRKESNDSMSNKRARMTLASSSSLPTKQSKSINTTFQSYIVSPAVRQKIIENIPKEMQHDDVLILERIHRFWLENNDDASSNIYEAAELTNISSSSPDLSPTVLDVPSGCTDSNVYKMLSPDAVLPVLHNAKDQMKVNCIMKGTHPNSFNYAVPDWNCGWGYGDDVLSDKDISWF